MKWYQCARCDAGYPDQGCTCAPRFEPGPPMPEHEKQRIADALKMSGLNAVVAGAKPTAPDRPSNKAPKWWALEVPEKGFGGYWVHPSGGFMNRAEERGLWATRAAAVQAAYDFKCEASTCPVEVEPPPVDPVNNPPHYNQGAVECIDAIESALGPAGFRAYCKGNALKYIWREEHKGGTESIEKAIWYLNRLVKP